MSHSVGVNTQKSVLQWVTLIPHPQSCSPSIFQVPLRVIKCVCVCIHAQLYDRVSRKTYDKKSLLYSPTHSFQKCELYLPRSAFSLRTSLKLSPLLRVDCLYFSRASFCPFLPKASVLIGPAWRPHLHLEKSECTHLTRSSSFTITFSETAMTSSYKR